VPQVGVTVGVFVGVFVGVMVGVLVTVLVGVIVGVIVGVLVPVLVGVIVGVIVGVSVGVAMVTNRTFCAWSDAPGFVATSVTVYRPDDVNVCAGFWSAEVLAEPDATSPKSQDQDVGSPLERSLNCTAWFTRGLAGE